MTVKTIYVADNGREFDNEEDCKQYENRISFSFQKEYAVGTEITFRVVKHTSCADCVFADLDNCDNFNCAKTMYELAEVKEP